MAVATALATVAEWGTPTAGSRAAWTAFGWVAGSGETTVHATAAYSADSWVGRWAAATAREKVVLLVAQTEKTRVDGWAEW
jgi:hypothetical protein